MRLLFNTWRKKTDLISSERRERVKEKLKARDKARLTYREILQSVIDKPLLLPPHCTTVSEHTAFQVVYL